MIDDNSRKRRRQDTYFPPRKRARIELNDINNDDDVNCNNKNKKDERVNQIQQNKKKIVPIITTNFTTLKRRRRSSSSECKRSTNNKQTNKRYRRRPLIRLLTVNKSKSSIVDASPTSSFREVIAQGKITHILRECHSKAFDSNGDNDTSSSTKDSLYGNGGENHMNTTCIFGNETFKSSPLLMPKELVDTPRDVIGKSNTASSPTSVAAINHLKEKQMPDDDDDVEENDGLYYMLRGTNTSHFTNDDDNGGDSTSDDSFASCQDVEPHDNENVTHTVTPRDDDTTNTAGDELDRQIDGDTTTTTNTSPTNLSVASTQTEYSELTSSPYDQDDDTNSLYSLPFHFMSPEEQSPNTSSFTSTPHSNISFSFAGQGYSPQRKVDSPILENNEYSPIKPRPSKRPIMTTPFPSTISLLPPSPPSEDEDASVQYDQSPPFNFMSEDYMTQQSAFNDDYEYMPRASLSSLIKYILRFVIEWLLRVLIGKVPSNNDDNINIIDPPTPPKPRDSISSSRLASATVTSQPSLCRRERQVNSSRTSISTPTSNVNVSAVDHQNEQTPASSGKCTTKTTVQHHVKKLPTTKPPSGWKNLFKPKEGEWKCKSCYYINPPEAMTCDSCTAIKDRPPGQVLKSCLRDKSTNVVHSGVSNNDTGKTPFKARREKREYDDSSIGNEENDEESDSYSSYESDSEEEGSETYSEDADEEESYRGAPEWTGENDEEETDDEEAEEESSPNKRVKRVVTSPSQAPPPPTPAPPQTIRKPTRSSYELVDDPSHNSDTAATTFTSSKRVKRDCTPQDMTSCSASSIVATQPGIIKRNLSDTMSEDIPSTSNKMARETSGESMMDDVSVIYSEMDTEQRPGLIQRKSSDNMSELSH